MNAGTNNACYILFNRLFSLVMSQTCVDFNVRTAVMNAHNICHLFFCFLFLNCLTFQLIALA
jgi:hypothetical protein